ncbi:Cell wall protein phiA [Pseudocercospora fuligena]|uniref:Cell wall protein phiA n=1 Tax=Pseudocercospora fuligena TaxID=685502 RepID=A0A8H6RM43_9PEZI|nr:Cell wall protein phiA [Pseudocercospora fuligena]
MQLIDFALIGLAIAAPTTQVSSIKEATTCPGLNGAQVLSNNNQAYRLDCAKWVDTDQVLRIVTTEIGYKGCLTACDGTIDCGLSQYIATDDAQTKGSCTLFKKGATVKQGSSNSWTLATKLDNKPAPKTPTVPVPGKDDKFGLIAIRSGSPIQNTGIKASKGRLTVGGKQDASCDTKSDFATFYVQNGEAYLYAASATPQQLWVDRSGMGQGVTGYTTGAQPAPRNAERKGFKVDKDGHLTFDGVSPKACPCKDKNAGWSLWFSTADKPGFNEGCLGVSLKAIKADKPVSCSYTSS